MLYCSLRHSQHCLVAERSRVCVCRDRVRVFWCGYVIDGDILTCSVSRHLLTRRVYVLFPPTLEGNRCFLLALPMPHPRSGDHLSLYLAIAKMRCLCWLQSALQLAEAARNRAAAARLPFGRHKPSASKPVPPHQGSGLRLCCGLSTPQNRHNRKYLPIEVLYRRPVMIS